MMRRLWMNLAAFGMVFGLVSCVTEPDGTSRPATPEEAAVMVETGTAVVAPATGPYAPLVAAVGGVVAVALREWGRISAMKEAARAKAAEDAAFDEGVKRSAGDGSVTP